jgi:hypothetical protein
MRSPSEPRNPLEVVEEALAGIASDLDAYDDGAWGFEGVPGDEAGSIHTRARAALALVRKMRADAVVGWVQWADDEHWLFEVTDEPSMAQDPALLLPLPDSTEDDDGD